MEKSFVNTWLKYVENLKCWRKQLKNNPHQVEINQEAIELAQSYGKKYHPHLTQLSSYVYPYLDKNFFRLANKWHLWLWLFDDMVDDPNLSLPERIKLAEAAVETLLDDTKPSIGILSLLVEIKKKLRDNLQPLVYGYWLTEVRNYLEKGVVAHLNNQQCNLSDYLKIRYYDGACNTVWPMMLLGEPDDINLEALADYNQAANQIISLTNDFFSYPKDTLIERTTFNFLCKYQEEMQVSLEETCQYVLTEIDNNYLFLVNNYQQLHQPKRKYVERLILWCEGSLLWHSQSPRYVIQSKL